MAVDILRTSVDALNPAGSIYRNQTPNGANEWLYIFNTSANQIEAGHLVVRKLAATEAEEFYGLTIPASATSNPGMCLGFAQHAIPAGHWGWVLKRGFGVILAAAAISANTAIKPVAVAAGSVSAAGATETAIAIKGAAAAALGPSTAFIRC